MTLVLKSSYNWWYTIFILTITTKVPPINCKSNYEIWFNTSLNRWASVLHTRLRLGSHALNEHLRLSAARLPSVTVEQIMKLLSIFSYTILDLLLNIHL